MLYLCRSCLDRIWQLCLSSIYEVCPVSVLQCGCKIEVAVVDFAYKSLASMVSIGASFLGSSLFLLHTAMVYGQYASTFSVPIPLFHKSPYFNAWLPTNASVYNQGDPPWSMPYGFVRSPSSPLVLTILTSDGVRRLDDGCSCR